MKSLDSFDFAAIPSLNKTPRSGTRPLGIYHPPGEYHRGRQLRHRQDAHRSRARARGLPEGAIGRLLYTAAALVHELLEARDEKRLLRLQRQLAGYKLLIIDELGYVPLSQTGAEKLLFEAFSQRYERGSTVVTLEPAVR